MMTRRSVMITALGLAAAFLIACHPLVNPVDPRSTTYTGIPTGSDGDDPRDTPDPLLPATAKWELVTDHMPGRMLPLEITDDESFIEPRDAGWYELWITLSDSFEWEQTDGAILWIAVNDGGSTYYSAAGLSDVIPEQRRLVVSFGDIPNQTRIRLRLVDWNGTVIGERVVGRLIGDVDGNGMVDVAVDHGVAIVTLNGFAVSTDNPNTIRADLDLDGVIEPLPGDDGNVVATHDTETLPPTAPEFWD